MEFVLRDRLGDVVDLTGYTIHFAAKRTISDADSDKLFDITASIVSAADGRYSITLTRSQTSFPAGRYVAELRWWTSGGPPDTADDSESSNYVVEEAVVRVEI